MLKVLQGWLCAIRHLSMNWFHRGSVRQRLGHSALRIRAGALNQELADLELPTPSQSRPSIPEAGARPKSAAPGLGRSGTTRYLVVTCIAQFAHNPENELREFRDHRGPEHEIGEGHHRFATIDALEAFIGEARCKFGVLAERFQVGVVVQQIFANPIRDRVLQLSSTLVRRANLVRLLGQEQRTGVTELFPVVDEGSGFEDGTTGFRRTRHAITILEFTQLQALSTKLSTLPTFQPRITPLGRSVRLGAAHVQGHAPISAFSPHVRLTHQPTLSSGRRRHCCRNPAVRDGKP